jgi:hypothetical protein
VKRDPVLMSPGGITVTDLRDGLAVASEESLGNLCKTQRFLRQKDVPPRAMAQAIVREGRQKPRFLPAVL